MATYNEQGRGTRSGVREGGTRGRSLQKEEGKDEMEEVGGQGGYGKYERGER